MLTFSELCDGFAYLAIQHPKEDLLNLYDRYEEYLYRNRLGDDGCRFMKIIEIGERARQAPEWMQKEIVRSLKYKPEQCSDFIFRSGTHMNFNKKVDCDQKEGIDMSDALVRNNIKELELGQTQAIIALVKSVSTHKAKNGGTYQCVMIRDADQNETACMLWDNFMSPAKMRLPKIMRLTLNISQNNESLSYRLVHYEEEPNVNREPFMPKADFDRQAAWDELVHKTKTLRAPLKQIVAQVLKDAKAAFINLPMKTGYRGTGGILASTLKLVEACDAVSGIYKMDRDLLVAGAITYYVGKTECTDEMGNILADDVLIGEGALAYKKITLAKLKIEASCEGNPEKAAILEMLRNEEDVKLLDHIILSRATGVKTAIPEAILLRALSAVTVDLKEAETTAEHAFEGEIVQNPMLPGGRLYKR